MKKTETTIKNEQQPPKSELEKMRLFFEHTDDSRTVVNAQDKPIKQPTRNTASKR